MGRKILVVDDEPEIIELVRSRSEANQYEVIGAEDGMEGVKMAQSELPDIILMDIMMPNLAGGDAVRMLKANDQTKNIPVIFLTGVYGKNETSSGSKGINVGGEFYQSIAKPFESDKLIMEIEKLI